MFLSKEDILDCNLIANEGLDSRMQQRGGGTVFKADTMKAYDHVSWKFLEFVTSTIGFGNKWRRGIGICFANAKFSVMVNGPPKGFLRITRRIRKQDHLSTPLFILITQYLSKMANMLTEDDMVDGFRFSRSSFTVCG